MACAGDSGGGGVVYDVEALESVRSIVLKPSESLDESRFTRITGADFNDPGLGLEGLLASLSYTGFQASNLGDAIDVVNQMCFGFLHSKHALRLEVVT
ncbi:deoxyhypusine synthase-like isoform X2 [Miscanthus floridulus]|uniref:deoxyhypusine synthase-like isoform X2 n=1 Tax=Miscanthus floridulus TaxID=154761 RepID=UPI00345771AF